MAKCDFFPTLTIEKHVTKMVTVFLVQSNYKIALVSKFDVSIEKKPLCKYTLISIKVTG